MMQLDDPLAYLLFRRAGESVVSGTWAGEPLDMHCIPRIPMIGGNELASSFVNDVQAAGTPLPLSPYPNL